MGEKTTVENDEHHIDWQLLSVFWASKRTREKRIKKAFLAAKENNKFGYL